MIDFGMHSLARRARKRAWAILAAGAAVAGLAGTFTPPGAEKPGRILIDDRFCGIWEPTARQLDTQWYGDFPTYSFTSLAEWLGKWYSVDANTARTYDDELLSGYDVLILKTPEEPIPDAEIDAIDRFVHRGGGLLLVGDHTNLLGMGTHLNALSARYGIQFRYDSVSDGVTGGFVDYVGRRIGRHVGALHVRCAPVHDLVFAGDLRQCRGGPRHRRLPARAARLRRVELLRPPRGAPGDRTRPDRPGRHGAGRARPNCRVHGQHGLVVVRRLQPRPRDAGDGLGPDAESPAEPLRGADPRPGGRRGDDGPGRGMEAGRAPDRPCRRSCSDSPASGRAWRCRRACTASSTPGRSRTTRSPRSRSSGRAARVRSRRCSGRPTRSRPTGVTTPCSSRPSAWDWSRGSPSPTTTW